MTPNFVPPHGTIIITTTTSHVVKVWVRGHLVWHRGHKHWVPGHYEYRRVYF